MTDKPSRGLLSAGSRRGYKRQLLLILGTVALTCGHFASAAVGEALSGEPAYRTERNDSQPERVRMDSHQARFRVFRLRHISADKGKEYLSELQIGTVSKLPGGNMLLVTAQPKELVKAGATIELVDANEAYVIKQIAPALPAELLPLLGSIKAELGDTAVGTFYGRPDEIVQPQVIVDVHNGSLIAIAPASRIERVVSAVERLRTSGNGAKQQTVEDLLRDETIVPVASTQEPGQAPGQVDSAKVPQLEQSPRQNGDSHVIAELNATTESASDAGPASAADTNQSEGDELFARLLRSLEEAEKKAADAREKAAQGQEKATEPELKAIETDQPPEPVEPDEPPVVEIAPEPEVPAAPTLVEPPGLESTKPADAALTAVLERLEAIETALKTEQEPKRGPPAEVEQTAPKVEQPNDVNLPAEPVEETASSNSESVAGGEEILNVNIPQQLPLEVFLNFVGEHLGLNYLYDPAKIKGTVTLRLRGKLQGSIKKKDLYQMLQNVVQFHGYVMTRSGNLVTIRPITEAETSDPILVRAGQDKAETGDVAVTQVFELQHIDTASAKNLLEGMKLGIAVREITETGTLIVTGYKYRMGRIQELLDMVDKPGDPRQFRFRQLKFTMAETLAPKLKTLVEQLGEISITIAKSPTVTPTPTAPRTRPRRPAPKPQAPKPTGQATAQPGVYLDYDERTNRILMIGLEQDLDVVERLIESLDVQQRDLRSIRVYEIQHVDAQEVRDKLEELDMVSAGTARTSGRITGPGRPRPSQIRRPTGKTGATTPAPTSLSSTTATAEERLAGEPQIVILDTINSLLVNATAEQHAQIAMIIGYVDSTAEGISIPYVIYPLENADPEVLAPILNQLIQETTQQKDKEGKVLATTTKKRTEEDIIIISDASTYSLIVYASKKNQQWINSLIKQLDQYRPQVLLDVTLVSISKEQEFNWDLNLVSKFPKMVPGGQMEYLSGLIGNPAAGTIPDTFFPDNPIREVTSIGGSGTGFYADEHIQALLTAVESKGYGRVLARPKLLVNDNEPGTIKTETKTTIVSPKSDVLAAQGGVGSSAISVQLDSYVSDITLEIEPHISKGDQLRLQVTLNRTDFKERDDYSLSVAGDTIEGPTPPDLITTNVNTVVTVPDGKTIILGGLEQIAETKGGSKVPILGDIPILGALFRTVSNKDRQSRLYVFVKAQILRPGVEGVLSDVARVSDEHKAIFEKYEKEMQEYADFPGIKAKPMEPVRILEAD